MRGILSGLIFALGTWLLLPSFRSSDGDHRPDERTQILLNRITSTSSTEAFEAALLLQRSGNRAGISYLISVLSGERKASESIRCQAALAFASVGDNKVIPILLRIRVAASPNLRKSCDTALWRLDPARYPLYTDSKAASLISSVAP